MESGNRAARRALLSVFEPRHYGQLIFVVRKLLSSESVTRCREYRFDFLKHDEVWFALKLNGDAERAAETFFNPALDQGECFLWGRDYVAHHQVESFLWRPGKRVALNEGDCSVFHERGIEWAAVDSPDATACFG